MTADMTTDKPARMTTNQVARLLGCNGASVRHLVACGQLNCDLTPLGRLYNRSDVEALKAQRDQPDARRSWHNTPQA